MIDGEPSGPEIGFGKPPAANRFAKGRSGNPRGRPEGSRNKMAPYEAVLGQKGTVKSMGQPFYCVITQFVQTGILLLWITK